MSELVNNPEIAHTMFDVKRALDKCSMNQLIEAKEEVQNNNEDSMLKTAVLQEINMQIKERR